MNYVAREFKWNRGVGILHAPRPTDRIALQSDTGISVQTGKYRCGGASGIPNINNFKVVKNVSSQSD